MYLLQTLLNDKNDNKNDAITEIYKILRPENLQRLRLFQILIIFSSDRYDLSDVGRVRTR